MKAKKSPTKHHVLTTKESNIPTKKRKISLKNSLNKTSIRKESTEKKEALNKPNDKEIEQKNITEDEQTIDLKNTSHYLLNKMNLKLLQKEIFKLETRPMPYPDNLCSMENMKDLKISRLWFLFELEMILEQKINLRNSWYNSEIYQKIDDDWPSTNCLDEIPSEGYETFPLNQVYIRHIPEIQENQDTEKCAQIGNIDVDIESILDYVPSRKIPSSKLSLRNRKDVFENLNLDAKKILEDSSASDLFSSSTLQLPKKANIETNENTNTGKQPTKEQAKKKLCVLEEKLRHFTGLPE
ncbi:Mam1p NDAI_0A01570 [Naumovozyma dairenensis CBS 421]|uniref:Uncharacterized protein n=1 Tax=Naumovozyma dairenensis (strain ATCC 10597 / BCRC 20456 / CBS 421 / NBRC 0211 / NRRL Y-12639) TaxID=1071378 RepID=G0W3C7_NAUDC|nr:hypothetical protein NDAI_0A01570 [Naumovozyma dairenensis CBS 421]CCD22315.1 hypothetical protein NDAI_0A01570 [Naumovozyma dairenensis CBS 421]